MDQSLSQQPSPGLSSAYLWPLSVWLTASLLIHTLGLPHSPAALSHARKRKKKKKRPHIPDSVTTTISEGGFISETFSPTLSSHSFAVWATYVEGRRISTPCYPIAHCCCWAFLKPIHVLRPDSNIYEQFVILLRILGKFHAPRACGAHEHTSIICGIFMTLICVYRFGNMSVSSGLCPSKFVHNFILCQLLHDPLTKLTAPDLTVSHTLLLALSLAPL